MLKGSITPQGRALVPLTVFGPGTAAVDLTAVLDTGFGGDVVLSLSTITSLRLPKLGGQRVTVADGRSVWLDVYQAGVAWNGSVRRVYVLEAGEVPLAGSRLLTGCRLTADWVDGGVVEIAPLPLG